MKEKTKLQTKLTALAVTLFAAAVLPTGQVKAALQSNPNTQYKTQYNPTTWMTQIRQIETSGNAMGLSETLNSDLTSSSESNGIDVHMMKSTEYGAIAILSASGYGNSQTLQSSSVKTTTGNKTGIYFSGSNWEWVAGGLSGSIFSGVNSRYFDTYSGSQASARIGDALGSASTTNPGCAGWHSASYSYWVGSSYPYFLRGDGGLFSFDINYAGCSYYARGVAVVGAGLLYRMKYINISGQKGKF